jgi:cell shape-determining protein MreC
MIEYLHNGKRKKIPLLDVDRKYYPPRDPDPNAHISVTLAYMTFLINYVQNKLTEEFNAEYEEKQRQEERKKIEEYHKKQQELEQMRRRSTRYDSDISSLETFSRGDYATCPVCFRRCNNISCGCSNPTMFSVVGAMNGASKVLKENKELKQKVEALKKENEELLAKVE